MSLSDVRLGLLWAQDLAPLMPVTTYLPLVRNVGWALVLAALVGIAAHSAPLRPFRIPTRALMVLVALWACIPGTWGLSYWLGLAFQTPSLMAMVLSLQAIWQWLVHDRRQLAAPEWVVNRSRRRGPCWSCRYAALGLLMGWLLLLDTFAYLPISLYVWGFSPWVFGLLWLLAMWPWIMGARWSQSGPAPALVVVLALYGLMRWPTGNVWDAVLDPWLFVGLHLYLFRRYRAYQSA